MSALANHPFVKMNGLGNEIVVVDMRARAGALTASDARAAAQPRGVAYDQMMVLYLPRSPGTDAYVRIYNKDGSEAGACGNGMRCVAELLFKETGRRALTFETSSGVLCCWKGDAPLTSTVDMGVPRLRWDEIPLAKEMPDTRAIDLAVGPAGAPILRSPSAVNMGNPHAIFWVDDVDGYDLGQIGPIDAPVLHSPSALSMGNPHAIFWVEHVDRHDLGKIGPLLEHHPMFPERANISLAQVCSREHLIVRTWERGAGLTKACGSAACAAAVAAVRLRRTGRKVTVTLPGGDLAIEWRERDHHVLMTGTATFEYEASFDPALFASVA